MLLVSVDPAGCAYRVVEEAGAIAAGLGEPVLLMTAVDLPEGVSPDVAMDGGGYAGMTAEQVLVEDARKALDGLAMNLRDQGVRVKLEVRIGQPRQAALDACEDHKPRMLVVGTHARTGFKRFFLGSVAEQIIRQSTVPVLVVRAQPGMVDQPSDAHHAVAALADG